jgi:hypothetical protein
MGRSALAVLVTASLPFSTTNQAQPEPNWVVAAAVNASLNLSKEPKSRSIAAARSPLGAPPPFGFMLFQ